MMIILIDAFCEELDNVHDVRVLCFSLCENLKRCHAFGVDMSAMSAMSAFYYYLNTRTTTNILRVIAEKDKSISTIPVN